MSEAANLADELSAQYTAVRKQTERLCRPLAVDDYGVQPMADASPPKWHLAHTTWFFETFLLTPFADGYTRFDDAFGFLFNSYYNGVGEQYPRSKRGLLSRPTVGQVFDYRAHVDAAMQGLLSRENETLRERVILGINHEQQHQELIVTDIKYNLGTNPLRPAYSAQLDAEPSEARLASFVAVPGGLVEIGFAGEGFTFDNETPRHKVWLSEFALADRLVTSGEYLAFMNDGGYRDPSLWLSEGWTVVQQRGWNAPLYWYEQDGEWFEYRLGGSGPIELNSPVCHVSFFEADAFARWAGARLPTEAEWETAASSHAVTGNFSDSGRLHPMSSRGDGMTQLFGDAWEWTASAYGPYPRFKPLPGTLGEYNGKFMANQIVLRGGSCATPPGHVRASYRNFFYAPDRWQFSGIRLARDVR